MPKIYNKQRQREIALELALKRSMLELGFLHDKDVADYLNIPSSSFCIKKKEHFQRITLLQFATMARKLRWTAQEVCEMVGVPYPDQPE